MAGALIILSSMQAFALSSWFPSHRHGDRHDGGQVSHSAPGPVIGIGLPAAVALGGYLWMRNRNRKPKDKQ
jgi:hypothetical protein